jgi:response regulator RpfG family c-di-GMP phosphodiesterase
MKWGQIRATKRVYRQRFSQEVSELLIADEVFKDVNSLDKSVIEEITLIEELDKKEKQAFFIMLDALVAKKRLKDLLNSALNKA